MSDTGFRRSVDTGLFVPPALSRTRRVWTKDHARLVQRFARFLKAEDIGMILRCMHDTCDDAPLKKLREPGGIVLQCECRHRVLSVDF